MACDLGNVAGARCLEVEGCEEVVTVRARETEFIDAVDGPADVAEELAL